MLVSCASCSTKFNVPDDKVAGKRARMTCRKCGAVIHVDGRSLAPGASGDAAGASSHPPPSRSVTPAVRVETPAPLSAPVAASTRPSSAPTSPPGPVPAASPRSEPPTFNDETVALGAAEAAALTQQARIRGPNSEAPDAGDRVTPVSNPVNPKTFFDSGDVDRAMGLFENAIGAVRGPSSLAAAAPGARSPIAPTASAAAAPPAAPTTARQSSHSSEPITERPPKPVAAAAPVSLPPALGLAGLSRPRPAESSGPTTTRPLPFEPAPPIAVPSLPGQALPGQALPGQAQPVTHGQVVPAAATAAPFVIGPKPAAPTIPDDGRMERLRAQMAAGDRTQPQPEPARKGGGLGAVLLVLLLVLAAGAGGVYVARPDLVQQAFSLVRGKVPAPPPTAAAPTGPAIDQLAAVRQLTRIAESAKTCAVDDGPTGPGVASVTFAASGFAESATVSAPYSGTAVGKCIESRLMTTRVPPFAGAAVQINKNFFIFASPSGTPSAAASGDAAGAAPEETATNAATEPAPAPRPRNVRREKAATTPDEPASGAREAPEDPPESPVPATPSEPAAPGPAAPF